MAEQHPAPPPHPAARTAPAAAAETENSIWSRRGFTSLAAWAGILACIGTSLLAIVRMLFPRVLFEPPTAFKAGYPADYIVGEVSEKWMKSQRVWIIRTPEK